MFSNPLVLSVLCNNQLVYSVDASVSSRYAAHADREFLVLLDITPSQDMVDEGVAREVINKIQKLRKKVSSCGDVRTLKREHRE